MNANHNIPTANAADVAKTPTPPTIVESTPPATAKPTAAKRSAALAMDIEGDRSPAAKKPAPFTVADAARPATAKPTAANKSTAPALGVEGGRMALASSMSYIDRRVFEVENNGESDSNWSESDTEFEEEPADDEIEAGDYKPHSTRDNLSEESKGLLLWRQDKEDSFSDWKIEVSVANSDGDRNAVYHVHKVFLGAGPQKSGYWETLFKSRRFNESVNSTTALTLSEDVASIFPDFMDYMYSQPPACTSFINRKNWRSLQYLASYFVVPKLMEAIHEFVEEDMHNLEHMEEYLSEFGGAEDEESRKMVGIAGRICADKIFSIRLGSTLLTTLTPAIVLCMLQDALSSEDITTLPCSKKYHICRLALDSVKHHRNILDGRYFCLLVDQLHFPDDVNLAGDVAIKLLEILKLTGWKYCDRWTTEIKDHCTDVISRYLANIEPTYSTIAEITKKLPEDVLSDLLANELIAKKKRKREHQ